MKPITEGLRLNPEADAEALAHAGVLVPTSCEAVTKAEAQPVTTLGPGTGTQAESTQAGAPAESTQAGIQAVSGVLHNLAGSAPQSAPGFNMEPSTLLKTEVAGSNATPHLDPSLQTAGLAGSSRVSAHQDTVVAGNSVSESAGALLLHDMHAASGVGHLAGEVCGMSATPPEFGDSQQTEQVHVNGAGAVEMASMLPSSVKVESMRDAMAAGLHGHAEQDGTVVMDRLAKRPKLL